MNATVTTRCPAKKPAPADDPRNPYPADSILRHLWSPHHDLPHAPRPKRKRRR